MAAPRKTTQPVDTNSGDTEPQSTEDQARLAAAEQQPEQTPAPEQQPEQTTDPVDHAAAAIADARTALTTSTTEDVVLVKEAGGHKSGDTITVTRGAAEYLREQGYVDSEDTDEG